MRGIANTVHIPCSSSCVSGVRLVRQRRHMGHHNIDSHSPFAHHLQGSTERLSFAHSLHRLMAILDLLLDDHGSGYCSVGEREFHMKCKHSRGTCSIFAMYTVIASDTTKTSCSWSVKMDISPNSLTAKKQLPAPKLVGTVCPIGIGVASLSKKDKRCLVPL